ncbi:hypothetical protein [Micromonospora thermarum]|uniref:Transposase n=1 Tax=Micromonospora thermarum TaxID=2720024 RepID=A0ABX0Z7E7_9ACTN|nr:hypothetical protein [Micromonospora thermarum]NJP33752.1 hypothetical protein [Micromonospora thermarum]
MFLPTEGRLSGLERTDHRPARPRATDDHRIRWWQTEQTGEAVRFLLRVLTGLFDDRIGGC